MLIDFLIYFINESGPQGAPTDRHQQKPCHFPFVFLLYKFTLCFSSTSGSECSQGNGGENGQTDDNVARSVDLRDLKTLPDIPHLK